jgi:hypothetical protein
MKRSFARRLARCLAGVLFLAQMTIAAYACPGLSSAAAASQVEASSDPRVAAMAAQMPDCSDMAGAMDPDATSLCAEHCKYGQQSDHASTLVVPAVILNALYTMPVDPPAPLPRSAAALTGVPVAASRPHAILHCVFRI